MKKCKKCGACCVIGCCPEGIEDKNGYCVYMKIIDNDTILCQLILDNKAKHITIGKGCFLQTNHNIYKYYLKGRNLYIKHVLH